MSSNLEPWVVALIVIGCVIGGGIVFSKLVAVWAKATYKAIKKNPPSCCDIDAFVGPDNPVAATKVVLAALAHKIQTGFRKASSQPIPIELYKSPHYENLLVSRNMGTGDGIATENFDELFSKITDTNNGSTKTPIIIGTIRMGFGHHRLAYSTASWAVQSGHPTIFHDFLNIKSDESELIKTADEWYSRFSRIASEWGGPVEKLWGALMKTGDANVLRAAANQSAHLQPLLLQYPKSTPIITTHPLCALTAASAGFTNIVNLVIDNYPQWFLTVPKTLNLMQGPVNFESFLSMGVRPDECKLAGHWCPRELVTNIDTDCSRRIQRAEGKKPLRLLIPVGGAGAQRTFITQLIKAVADYVKAGKVQLLLNAGDHVHMKTAFLQVLDECSLDFDTVSDIDGVRTFQSKLLVDSKVEPTKNVTLFSFTDYFPAVATTDILCRVADVLTCKPSELAFYCVPKLHIRRVGDHEAHSAIRSSELGDGTVEAREILDALTYITLFLDSSDLLLSMNNAVIQNNKIGIYNGCKNAVELVLERNMTFSWRLQPANEDCTEQSIYNTGTIQTSNGFTSVPSNDGDDITRHPSTISSPWEKEKREIVF